MLNHTRVHMVYRDRILKLRLQQTSAGVAKEWFQVKPTNPLSAHPPYLPVALR